MFGANFDLGSDDEEDERRQPSELRNGVEENINEETFENLSGHHNPFLRDIRYVHDFYDNGELTVGETARRNQPPGISCSNPIRSSTSYVGEFVSSKLQGNTDLAQDANFKEHLTLKDDG